MRGYCGIGVFNIKSEFNYGSLFRSASCFNADFIFTIGKRFKQQHSDTTRSEKHLPLFQFADSDDFIQHIPYGCRLISVEVSDKARDLETFIHPERAIYLLGPEDGSISTKLLDKSYSIVHINTEHCLNVAVAGSIVLYDRQTKFRNTHRLP